MSFKRKEISKNTDSRLKRTDLIIHISVIFMLALVLFDSFIVGVPFHYILFYFFGLLLGKVFRFSHKVSINTETGMIKLTTNLLSLILLIFIIILRFFLGKTILESVNVAMVSDALYLFFIGLYYAKWKSLINQIDSFYYKRTINNYNTDSHE